MWVLTNLEGFGWIEINSGEHVSTFPQFDLPLVIDKFSVTARPILRVGSRPRWLSFLSTKWRVRGCFFECRELLEVVTGVDEGPFETDFFDAAQEETTEAEGLFNSPRRLTKWTMWSAEIQSRRAGGRRIGESWSMLTKRADIYSISRSRRIDSAVNGF